VHLHPHQFDLKHGWWIFYFENHIEFCAALSGSMEIIDGTMEPYSLSIWIDKEWWVDGDGKRHDGDTQLLIGKADIWSKTIKAEVITGETTTTGG